MSSLLAFILLAATEDDFVFALDALVNTICLMLMSPYYCGPKGNEHRLYRILCRPAIYCFCQQRFSLVYHKENKQRLKGDASNPRISLAPSQTDTESAARLYGGDKFAELGNTVSMTEQNLQVDKQHTV